jgi:asparagine synthase (glutamine-hydrolysing)
MCGICGSTRAGDGRVLRAMNALMHHRGPDDEGTFVDPGSGVGLGATRLSIIDVDGGHQPLANETKTVWAVQNGEIYNFQSLRSSLLDAGHRFSTRTDTEVLVHLYEEYGAELGHALEGMFAFAVWDMQKRRLLLGRDRYGEKPLFYAEVGGELTFASELTALLEGAGLSLELDPAAVDEYFTYGYVAGPSSIVAGVRQLLPGHTLQWDEAGRTARTACYWSPPRPPRTTSAPLPELVRETEQLLEGSVRSRLVADVPVGVFLSGGVDSTLVAALAARNVGGLRTFTVGYETGDVNETVAARRSAAAIGSEHHELLLTNDDVAELVPATAAALDQPIADQAMVPLRALSGFARRTIKVAVGGEGADEVFGGYPRYRWLARASAVPGWLPRGALLVGTRLAAQVPGLERMARLERVLERAEPFERHLSWVAAGRLHARPNVYGPRLLSYLDRPRRPIPWDGSTPLGSRGDLLGDLMRLDQSHWLPGDVLAKADRASMQASLELRTPYLSRELVEFASGLPAAWHVRGGGKRLLRRVLQRVLPAAAHERGKVAFRTPAAEWLRGPLAPALWDHVASSSLYRDGWFDRGGVEAHVRTHQNGGDSSSVLWPLLVLGLWLDGNAHGRN